MPRGDGSGPMGAGAMTGRRGGYSTGAAVPGYAGAFGARGRGGATGWFGGRRGGWGGGICCGGGAMRPTLTAEKNLLENQAQALQTELELIKNRLSQLASEKKEE